MKNEIGRVWKNTRKRLFNGRAAGAITLAVTVFLCTLTLLQFTAWELEWEIPVLEVLSGKEDGLCAKEYRREEMALDESSKNELLEAANGNSGLNNAENTEAVTETRQEGEHHTLDTETETEAAFEAEFPYYVKVNRKQNCITIYTLDDNEEYTIPYKAMVCSTGLYNATPRGTYPLSTKYLWRELYGGVYGQYASRITGGILFHSVPYYRKSKNTLCTEKYNKLGQQASMGCIRLTVEDAKWIAENCPSGTLVEIYDDENPGPLGKPEVQKIDLDTPNKSWDPTDPDEENPWHQISDDK